MADKKISQLTSAVLPLAGTEVVPVVQSGATVKVSAASLGAAAAYTPAGTGAVVTTVQEKLRESVSVKDFGAVGDGVTDDTAAIQAAINATPQRGRLFFPVASSPSAGYKITNTLNFIGKAGCVIDFNNQQINASSFSSSKPALYFLNNSEIQVRNVFLIGNVTYVSQGVFVDATSGNITIHALFENIHVDSCNVGFQWGPTTTYQASDSEVRNIYASGCVKGIYLTGNNSLAMKYGVLATYLSSNIGVHIEMGGGVIDFLNVGYSTNSDIYFGSVGGANNNKLVRWDINGGYTENGVTGCVWINSSYCTDTNPYLGQVHIQGYRCTPFSANAMNTIQWCLNGDLKLTNCTIDAGQQLPRINLAPNYTYRAPKVSFNEGSHSVSPTSAPQNSLDYAMTSNKSPVEINTKVYNGIDWWQNAGSTNSGTIPNGIYTQKLVDFEKSILSTVPSLLGFWTLRDLPSGTCKNLVLGYPDLTLSASMQRGDMWLNDGLVGLLQTGVNTNKTLSTTSATFSAQAAYTFGSILRSISGTDAVDTHNLGGANAIRIGITGGNAVCRVGGVSTTVALANQYDPHLVLASYSSAASVFLYAINLRTGAVVSTTNSTSIPAFGSLTWVNGVNINSASMVRGATFVSTSTITLPVATALGLQATQLTSSWREA